MVTKTDRAGGLVAAEVSAWLAAGGEISRHRLGESGLTPPVKPASGGDRATLADPDTIAEPWTAAEDRMAARLDGDVDPTKAEHEALTDVQALEFLAVFSNLTRRQQEAIFFRWLAPGPVRGAVGAAWMGVSVASLDQHRKAAVAAARRSITMRQRLTHRALISAYQVRGNDPTPPDNTPPPADIGGAFSRADLTANTSLGHNPMELLTCEQAAVALNISIETIRRRVRDGLLPSYKMGRSRRIKRADLDAYCKSALAA